MNDFTSAFAAALDLILRFDGELMEIVFVSLRVSLSAVILGFVIGVPCGAALALWRFPGRRVLIAFANASAVATGTAFRTSLTKGSTRRV